MTRRRRLPILKVAILSFLQLFSNSNSTNLLIKSTLQKIVISGSQFCGDWFTEFYFFKKILMLPVIYPIFIGLLDILQCSHFLSAK